MHNKAHTNRKQVEIPSLNLCELYNLNKKNTRQREHDAMFVCNRRSASECEMEGYGGAEGNRSEISGIVGINVSLCCQRQSYCAIMAEIKTTTMRDYNLYGNEWPWPFGFTLHRTRIARSTHPPLSFAHSIREDSLFFMFLLEKKNIFIFICRILLLSICTATFSMCALRKCLGPTRAGMCLWMCVV